MLHHVARKRKRIIAADSWARVKALPARKRQVHNPEEAPCSDFTLQSPQTRSKFCPARAEHRCRAKALVRTKAATLGIPLGPNPCQGKDQHRHAREFNATRSRLRGPKRPGSLARSGSRSGLARIVRVLHHLASKTKCIIVAEQLGHQVPNSSWARTLCKSLTSKRTTSP